MKNGLPTGRGEGNNNNYIGWTKFTKPLPYKNSDSSCASRVFTIQSGVERCPWIVVTADHKKAKVKLKLS